MAVMFHSPDGCASHGKWGTRGWWRIEPGATAFALRTNNRYAAYYAESASGKTWSGDRGPVYVYQQAFDSCIGIGSSAARTIKIRRDRVESELLQVPSRTFPAQAQSRRIVGQRPVAPSMSSRRMSRCPAWRAVSSIM